MSKISAIQGSTKHLAREMEEVLRSIPVKSTPRPNAPCPSSLLGREIKTVFPEQSMPKNKPTGCYMNIDGQKINFYA